MFDEVEVVFNGKSIKGFPALLIIASPFTACIFLGIMIGVQL